ncbi:MAG: GNAT family N-acetyltransferase [bacterium]|nr:MAG: GNAT family N-acetyltransferase [bacterium]
MLFERYPKEVELQDGSRVVLRPMIRDDEDPLIDFFATLTDRDRLYLRNDVSNARLIRSWFENIDYKRVLPILAVSGKRIVGNGTLHRRPFSWMKHIAEIRIVISPDHRKKGLARALAKELIDNAIDEELDKLTADFAAEQKTALKVFSRLGFKKEATMKNYVTDAAGNRCDLVVMTKDISE